MVAAQAKRDDPLLLDRQVCFPLYAATNLLNRLYTPVLAELGLTYPQYLVMLGARAEHVPETVGGGYTSDGIEELRDSVRDLVSILAQRDGRGSLARCTDPKPKR